MYTFLGQGKIITLTTTDYFRRIHALQDIQSCPELNLLQNLYICITKLDSEVTFTNDIVEVAFNFLPIFLDL